MKNNSSTIDLKLTNNERLFLETKSVFKPKNIKDYIPKNFKVFTFNAGFKKKFDDLLIIIFDKVITSSCIYSKTSTPSAPILWDKKYNRGDVKALIVNSGNANAHTGKKGLTIINEYTKYLSKLIKCKKNEILVSSTGVIGEIFDPKLIINKMKKINQSKSTSLLNAAKSIMTTDTYPKISVNNVKIENKNIKIFGIAKGSGMIKPNMGTMLAYIFIDISLSKKVLKQLIYENAENTFNSISVDSDTSTSDTLVLFSTSNQKINIKKNKNFKNLNLAIYKVMRDLSLQVIKDGEGLSKLIKVNILKCKSKKQAKEIGFSIVDSPLVKTAIAGQDANWGRIIMAIGKSNINLDQNKIKIFFGKNLVCSNGAANKKINTKKINKYMKNKIIEITAIINNGEIDHSVYGNDLTRKYVEINADYRS